MLEYLNMQLFNNLNLYFYVDAQQNEESAIYSRGMDIEARK